MQFKITTIIAVGTFFALAAALPSPNESRGEKTPEELWTKQVPVPEGYTPNLEGLAPKALDKRQYWVGDCYVDVFS